VTQARIIAALAALALWGASLALVGFKSYSLGVGSQKAKQADVEAARQQARDDAMKGAADAIAQVKITNTTIRAATETRVREVPVYRDCRNDDRVLNNINSALRGEPAGRGVMPASAGASR
jgi:preprotein translocase subunit SecF